MTGTAVAVRETTFDIAPKAWDIAEKIARTSSVPAAFRGKPDEIMATILVGHELELSAMTSLQKIHVIEGRPTLSAEVMTGIVMSHGHEVWVEESSATRVTVCGQRKGSTHVQRVTWTMDDAQRAGLAGKQNWRKYPRQMLSARARAEMCRLLAPDVLAGIAYSKEEVEDGFVFDEPVTEDEVVTDAPAEAAPQNVRQLGTAKPKAAAKKAAPAKKAAAKKAAAPRATPPAAEDLPPLPGDDDDDVVDAVVVEDQEPADGPTDGQVRRAQRIAMKARDLDVDHHDIVYVITAGRHTSAKGLTDAEAEAVLEALRLLKVGAKTLDTSGDEPVLRDVEPEAGPAGDDEGPDLGDVEQWDAETWKRYLSANGRKVVPSLMVAKRVAGEAGLDEPTSFADLQGTSLAALVAAALEEAR